MRNGTERDGSFGTWIVTEGDKQTETEDFRETEKIILIIFLFLVLKLLCQQWKEVKGTDFSFCSLAKTV